MLQFRSSMDTHFGVRGQCPRCGRVVGVVPGRLGFVARRHMPNRVQVRGFKYPPCVGTGQLVTQVG